MNILDWVLIIGLFSYVWGGWLTGLIQSIGGLIGLLLATILAPRFAGPFGEFLTPVFGNSEVIAKIVAFFLVFMIITRLVGILFILVNRAFNMIAILPGMKIMNRLGGAIFGFLEGALFLGIILQYAVRLPLGPKFTDTIDTSQLAAILMGLSAWLVGLFPQALRETEKVIDKVSSQ